MMPLLIPKRSIAVVVQVPHDAVVATETVDVAVVQVPPKAARFEALSAAAPVEVHVATEALSDASPVEVHDDAAPAEVLSAAVLVEVPDDSVATATAVTAAPLPTPEHAALQQAYGQLKAEYKKRDEKFFYEYLNLQPEAWTRISVI